MGKAEWEKALRPTMWGAHAPVFFSAAADAVLLPGLPTRALISRYGWQKHQARWMHVDAFLLAWIGPGFPSTSPTDGVCFLSHDKKGKYLVQSASRQRQTYGRWDASLDGLENAVKALQQLLDVGLSLSWVRYKIQGNLWRALVQVFCSGCCGLNPLIISLTLISPTVPSLLY